MYGKWHRDWGSRELSHVNDGALSEWRSMNLSCWGPWNCPSLGTSWACCYNFPVDSMSFVPKINLSGFSFSLLKLLSKKNLIKKALIRLRLWLLLPTAEKFPIANTQPTNAPAVQLTAGAGDPTAGAGARRGSGDRGFCSRLPAQSVRGVQQEKYRNWVSI